LHGLVVFGDSADPRTETAPPDDPLPEIRVAGTLAGG